MFPSTSDVSEWFADSTATICKQSRQKPQVLSTKRRRVAAQPRSRAAPEALAKAAESQPLFKMHEQNKLCASPTLSDGWRQVTALCVL